MLTFKAISPKDETISIFRNNNFRCNRLFLSGIFGFMISFCLGYFLIILSNQIMLTYTLTRFEYDTEPKFKIQLQNFIGHSHKNENTTLADKLHVEIRVLCWILTSPANHEIRAKHVKLTWGHRCNKLIFISSEDDEDLGAINVNVTEGRTHLWDKTRAAFSYIYENHINEYDWFLKADDDTYIIMENLRYMLSAHSKDTPIYFGCKFQKPSVVYMSGGAGYVLSREAVKRLVKIAFKNSQICRIDTSIEDFEMGVCLQAVGVMAGDSRDEKGKSKFHPLGFNNQLELFSIKNDLWLWNYSYYKFNSGLNYVSDRAISFHYLEAIEMYILDYLIYHVKPFGISFTPENLQEGPLTFDEEIKKLREADSDRNLI